MSSKFAKLFYLVSAFQLGILAYLTTSAFQNVLPSCRIVQGCELILTSSYSKFLGLPVSLYAFCGIALVLGLCVSCKTIVYARWIALIQLFVAGVFQYIAKVLLHATCVYCLTVFALYLAIVILLEIPGGKGLRIPWKVNLAMCIVGAIVGGSLSQILAGRSQADLRGAQVVKSLWLSRRSALGFFDANCLACRRLLVQLDTKGYLEPSLAESIIFVRPIDGNYIFDPGLTRHFRRMDSQAQLLMSHFKSNTEAPVSVGSLETNSEFKIEKSLVDNIRLQGTPTFVIRDEADRWRYATFEDFVSWIRTRSRVGKAQSP